MLACSFFPIKKRIAAFRAYCTFLPQNALPNKMLAQQLELEQKYPIFVVVLECSYYFYSKDSFSKLK
jgi:hypothetical protein